MERAKGCPLGIGVIRMNRRQMDFEDDSLIGTLIGPNFPTYSSSAK